MKKIIFLVAMVALSFSMNAQNEAGKIMLGGFLGLNTESAKLSDMNNNKDSNLSFSIAPEVGYSLTDRWQVGLGLAYTLDKKKEYNAALDKREDTYKQDLFVIAPFARYFCPINDNFSFAAKGELGFGFGKADLEKANVFRFGISVVPEIWIHATENLSLIGSVGELGFTVGNNKWDDYKVKYSAFRLNWAAFSLGVNYAF